MVIYSGGLECEGADDTACLAADVRTAARALTKARSVAMKRASIGVKSRPTVTPFSRPIQHAIIASFTFTLRDGGVPDMSVLTVLLC